MFEKQPFGSKFQNCHETMGSAKPKSGQQNTNNMLSLSSLFSQPKCIYLCHFLNWKKKMALRAFVTKLMASAVLQMMTSSGRFTPVESRQLFFCSPQISGEHPIERKTVFFSTHSQRWPRATQAFQFQGLFLSALNLWFLSVHKQRAFFFDMAKIGRCIPAWKCLSSPILHAVYSLSSRSHFCPHRSWWIQNLQDRQICSWFCDLFWLRARKFI